MEEKEEREGRVRRGSSCSTSSKDAQTGCEHSQHSQGGSRLIPESGVSLVHIVNSSPVKTLSLKKQKQRTLNIISYQANVN